MICTHSQRPCFVVLSLFYERGGGENGSNQWLKKVFFPNRCVDGSKMYILLRRTTFFFLDNSKNIRCSSFFQLRTPTFFLEKHWSPGMWDVCVCADMRRFSFVVSLSLFRLKMSALVGRSGLGDGFFFLSFFVIVWRRRAEETGYIR